MSKDRVEEFYITIFFWYTQVSRTRRGCKAVYHIIPRECKSRIWLMLKSVKQCSVRYKATLGENKQKQTEGKKNETKEKEL